MKTRPHFAKFEKAPSLIQFMNMFGSDNRAYKDYMRNYKKLLVAVTVAVEENAMSEEEGRNLLEQCRK